MTKRDYEGIAKILNQYVDPRRLGVADHITTKLADYFEATNAHFDRDKFFHAVYLVGKYKGETSG